MRAAKLDVPTPLAVVPRALAPELWLAVCLPASAAASGAGRNMAGGDASGSTVLAPWLAMTRAPAAGKPASTDDSPCGRLKLRLAKPGDRGGVMRRVPMVAAPRVPLVVPPNAVAKRALELPPALVPGAGAAAVTGVTGCRVAGVTRAAAGAGAAAAAPAPARAGAALLVACFADAAAAAVVVAPGATPDLDLGVGVGGSRAAEVERGCGLGSTATPKCDRGPGSGARVVHVLSPGSKASTVA